MTTMVKRPSLSSMDLYELLEAGKQGEAAVGAVLRKFWAKKQDFSGTEDIGHPTVEFKKEE